MGLLNQPPPTVLGALIPLCTTESRDFRKSFGEVSIRSLALATRPPNSGYPTTTTNPVATIQQARHDVRRRPQSSTRPRRLGGRVGKAPCRLDVSRPS